MAGLTAVRAGRRAGLTQALNGGEAVALAMKQVDPEVVAAYPITPQTFIIERFSEYFASGEVSTEYLNVESEHAAMSACIGASAAGARAETATSGPGLALMFEVLWVASGMRLPIVMQLCTRSLSAPLNILCDHSDAMAMRETSWVMLFGSSPQEAYDQAVIAHGIAEHGSIRLPLANVLDGFTVTHSVERVDVLPDDLVRALNGEYEPEEYALRPGSGATFGGLDAADFYFAHKRQQVEAMANVPGVVTESLSKLQDVSGRKYGLVEPYMLDDADVAMVVLGSSDGVVRAAVDDARRDGIRAGSLRVRLYRPFPAAEVAAALAGAGAVGVLDRAIGFGAPCNPLFGDVLASVHRAPVLPILKDFVYGLGGRNTPRKLFRQAIQEMADALEAGRAGAPVGYLGLE